MAMMDARDWFVLLLLSSAWSWLTTWPQSWDLIVLGCMALLAFVLAGHD